MALVFVLFVRWFRLSKLLVSVWRWYWSFGAGFGRPVRAVISFVQIVGGVWCWYWSFGAGVGRSVCAAVSSDLFLWSEPSVGTPSRDLAKN